MKTIRCPECHARWLRNEAYRGCSTCNGPGHIPARFDYALGTWVPAFQDPFADPIWWKHGFRPLSRETMARINGEP